MCSIIPLDHARTTVSQGLQGTERAGTSGRPRARLITDAPASQLRPK